MTPNIKKTADLIKPYSNVPLSSLAFLMQRRMVALSLNIVLGTVTGTRKQSQISRVRVNMLHEKLTLIWKATGKQCLAAH